MKKDEASTLSFTECFDAGWVRSRASGPLKPVSFILSCFLLVRVEEETKVEPADPGSPGEQRWCATLALKSTSTGNVSGLVRQSQGKPKVLCG